MGDERDDPVEDVTALREQLEEARAEVGRLETFAADAEAGARRAGDEVASLRERGDEAEALRAQLDAAAARERAGVERYRELLLRAEPDVPAEMLAGESVEQLDASLAAAREVVGRVRAHLSEHGPRVPGGAPARDGARFDAMTPEQKIRHGLAERGIA
jgi:hypothetical protein